jgi:SAM-dependent MidA family methyltransferase
LTTHREHTVGAESWLADPGHVDITAHVNLTALARDASEAGLIPLGMTDQMYFLLSLGIGDRVPQNDDRAAVAARLSAKTLLLPGGLGTTMKAIGFAKGLGRPLLRGFASARLT